MRKEKKKALIFKIQLLQNCLEVAGHCISAAQEHLNSIKESLSINAHEMGK